MQTMTPAGTFFKSQQHHDRFVEIVLKLGKTWGKGSTRFDSEYGAALYLLTAERGIWDWAAPFVSHNGIKFDELLDTPLSTSERTMLLWAANLFNPVLDGVYAVELTSLDETNFELAITALKIRRSGYQEE